MDLSILERVFALRDEARQAQLGADAPDLSNLSRGADSGEVVHPPSLPHEKLAADFMARAVALHEQAKKPKSKKDHASRGAIAELLHVASARLPAFDESDLALERAAPIDKTEEKAVTSALETGVEEPRPAPARKNAPRKKNVPREKKGGGGTRKRK